MRFPLGLFLFVLGGLFPQDSSAVKSPLPTADFSVKRELRLMSIYYMPFCHALYQNDLICTASRSLT